MKQAHTFPYALVARMLALAVPAIFVIGCADGDAADKQAVAPASHNVVWYGWPPSAAHPFQSWAAH